MPEAFGTVRRGRRQPAKDNGQDVLSHRVLLTDKSQRGQVAGRGLGAGVPPTCP
jgi:hypothetical protein